MKFDAPVCPSHGVPARLVPDRQVYGRSFGGRVWICPAPRCEARVGAHPDGSPKGTMATRSLRRARREAHRVFDGWWQSQGMTRGQAYSVLAKIFAVPVAHIGEMDEGQCAQVVELFGPMLEVVS